MLGAHKSKDQTLPLLVRHILASTGAQDSLVVKGGLYVTLVSDGPMSSRSGSQFTVHFPSSDNRAIPGSTWRVTCKNRHYALGTGWSEHEKVSLSLGLWAKCRRHLGKALEPMVGGQVLGDRASQPGFQHGQLVRVCGRHLAFPHHTWELT